MPAVLDEAPQALVGLSPQIEKIRGLIRKVARTRAPVLILGESGTGKEVVARSIYQAGPRGTFVTIDCGALSETLIDSELFGHTKGSFTGASEAKKGLVEEADGGTAFFDEIGDLRPELQVKLLRLLQEHEVRAIGSLRSRKVDIRVIAATNRDLAKDVESGRFREDLYYRLKVLTLRLPPLRDHRSDIPLLVDHFLRQFASPLRLNPDAMRAFQDYDWPGNVRELRNAIEQMTVLNSGPALHFADLPSVVRFYNAASDPPATVPDSQPGEFIPSIELRSPPPLSRMQASERRTIEETLRRLGGRRAEAARELGIGRTTLYRKMKEYKIEA